MATYRTEAILKVSRPHQTPMDECPISIECGEDKADARIDLEDGLYGVEAYARTLPICNPELAFEWATRAILAEAITAFEFDQARAVRDDDGAVVFIVSVDY